MMRTNRFLLLVFSLCVLLIVGQVGSAQAQVADTLIVDSKVSPSSGPIDGTEFDITVSVTGVNTECQAVAVPRPLDIVLVLDRSDSMFWNLSDGTRRIDALVPAVKVFLNQIQQNPDHQASIVEFASAANIIQPLTNDQALLQTAVDSIDEGGSTSIGSGLFAGQTELQLHGRDEASHVIIVFTDADGVNDEDFALERAVAAKQDGARVMTIRLGDGSQVAPSLETLLRQIASTPEDYFATETPNELQAVYERIAEAVTTQPTAATDVVIRHTFDPSSVELVPNSISGNGQESNGTISWVVQDFPAGTAEFSYSLRPLTAGTINLVQQEEIQYNACGAESKTQAVSSRLPVQVIPLTPTPTPTPTLTPIPTLTPTPVPTTIPQFDDTEVIPQPNPIIAFLCDPAGWGWLVALLLLLFFLFWFWKLWQELQQPKEERNVCRWIPWLLIPWFILFLWRVLSVTGVCGVSETLYFWRIEPNSSNGEIWTADLDGSRLAEEFDAINNHSDCVGCHAVSSTSRRIAAISESGTGPVIVYDLDGQQIEVPEVIGSFANWSPDGRKLAVSTANMDITIIDVDAGTMQPLEGASESNINEGMPAWSADGQTIAFVKGEEAPNTFAFSGSAGIYTIPATGGTASPLEGASEDGFNYYPAYSPDGKWLAFTRHQGSTTYAAPEAEIFIVPAEGGQNDRLAANDNNGTVLKNVSNSWTTWSLDGTKLAFNSKRSGTSYDLYITNIDENGKSGIAQPLAQAADPDAFEHLPFWGVPPETDTWPALLALWPWLLLPFLIWLAYWLCRRMHRDVVAPVPSVDTRQPPSPLPPIKLEPLWQVAPTLVVGVGGTGRWVLTHLKKSLLDGGFGERRDGVRFVLLDTSEREANNRYRNASGEIETVSFAGVSLSNDEILLMGQNMSKVIAAASQDEMLQGWLPVSTYRGLGDQQKDLSNGTYARRPMARAGLIDQLRQTDESAESQAAANLWSALVKRCEEVKDDRLIRIIVVGSLAGGMSGTLFDVTHLARKAAESVNTDDGSVHVEGYFATPDVFRSHVRNFGRLQVNAFSTARELQRFQVTKGLPFPMHYSDKQHQALQHLQMHSKELFDDITLFGADGLPEQGSGKSDAPWATTFASMADVITFRLDKATGAGSRGEYRSEARADVAIRQQQIQQAVVGSAGSYVYRLPLVDILAIVQSRWTEQLLRTFLMGDSDGDALSFNHQDAGLDDDPAIHAFHFLSGRHPANSQPPGLTALGHLIGGDAPLARYVLELSNNAGARDSYDLYLRNAIGLLLNGSSNQGGLARRAPLLGYAEAFLKEAEYRLMGALQLARGQMETASRGKRGIIGRLLIRIGFGTPNRKEWEDVVTVLTSWHQITAKSYSSLSGVRLLLTGGTVDTQEGVPGLYDEVRKRRQVAELRREQLNQVAVRRYLWERPGDDERDSDARVDLVDEWYESVESELIHHLGRFYWHVTQNGQVYLQLIGFEGERNIALVDGDTATISQMADEIGRLAAYATQEFAQAKSLADALPTQFSSRSMEPDLDLLQHAWEHASPHIKLARRENVPAGDSLSVAGIPSNVQSHAELNILTRTLRDLPNRMSQTFNPLSTQTIETTDRTSMTVVRENALMPMMELNDLQRAQTTYMQNAGSATDQGLESAEQTLVFEAESAALAFESRLEAPHILNQEMRLLHPLVVWALERTDIAELYLLAFAAGWVSVDQSVTPAVAWLTLPNSARYKLELPHQLQVGGHVDARVAGLVRIASQLLEDEALLSALRQQLSDPSQSLIKSWQGFINAYRPRSAPPPPVCIEARMCKWASVATGTKILR